MFREPIGRPTPATLRLMQEVAQYDRMGDSANKCGPKGPRIGRPLGAQDKGPRCTKGAWINEARDREFLRLFDLGLTAKEISEKKDVNESTVVQALHSTRKRLGIKASFRRPGPPPDDERDKQVMELWNAGHDSHTIAKRLNLMRSAVYTRICRMRKKGYQIRNAKERAA